MRQSWISQQGQFAEMLENKRISRSTSKPERFVVNLDQPATERWNHIVTRKPYVDLVPKFKKAIK